MIFDLVNLSIIAYVRSVAWVGRHYIPVIIHCMLTESQARQGTNCHMLVPKTCIKHYQSQNKDHGVCLKTAKYVSAAMGPQLSHQSHWSVAISSRSGKKGALKMIETAPHDCAHFTMARHIVLE